LSCDRNTALRYMVLRRSVPAMSPRFSHLPLRHIVHCSYRRSHRPLVGIAAVSGGLLLAAGCIHADNLEQNVTRQPLGHLIRSYVVFTMCSISPMVEYSPKILSFLTSIPGVRQIAEAIVRATFFNQVCPLHEICSHGLYSTVCLVLWRRYCRRYSSSTSCLSQSKQRSSSRLFGRG